MIDPTNIAEAVARAFTRFLTKREPTAEQNRYRIAVAQFAQETNSFSPVLTTLRDFEAMGLYYGGEVERQVKANGRSILRGFWAAAKDFGRRQVDVVPIMSAMAMSGGPIQRDVYDELKGNLLKGIRNAGDVDGVYLCLHGAMGVENTHDPDGDLIRSVRDIVGPEVPIGVSFDLHANITKAKVGNATFIVGYKTNPHRDFFETGYTCGKLLIRTIRDEIHPTMEFIKMRLLKGGGMTVDFLHPTKKIFKAMNTAEKKEKVLSVSNFMVHLWLDDLELGWATVAVTDNDADVARNTAENLAALNWSVRNVKHPEGITASEAITIARSKKLARLLGVVVMCDVSDAVGAGAPGENTWILKALLEEGRDLVSYIPVRDQEAAAKAYEAGLHETITLTVGGKLDTIYNRSVTLTAEVIHKADSRLGKTAIVRSDGIHLILTELPAYVHKPSFFTDLGLKITKSDILVVKNLFPFRFTFALHNRKTLDVVTPGITNVDVFSLNYRYIPRPIYPLDKIDNWG